jgi:hypothetical protein
LVVRRLSPTYARADGGYAENWAPADRPVLVLAVVCLLDRRCRRCARGSRRDKG